MIDAGASVIVAQGSEAGGHGMKSSLGRGTFTLVPEVADIVAKVAPETLVIAAGGISDGRGLAASLMLGADGAMIGSRAWATRESLASAMAKQVAIAATGDGTIRSPIFDLLRGKDWPEPYDFRSIRNALHREWEGRESELQARIVEARSRYDQGVASENYDLAHVTVGESVGLIHDTPSSAELITQMVSEAIDRLSLNY